MHTQSLHLSCQQQALSCAATAKYVLAETAQNSMLTGNACTHMQKQMWTQTHACTHTRIHALSITIRLTADLPVTVNISGSRTIVQEQPQKRFVALCCCNLIRVVTLYAGCLTWADEDYEKSMRKKTACSQASDQSGCRRCCEEGHRQE